MKIRQIVKKALDGGVLAEEELRELFAVDTLSEEASLIQFASRKMSEEAVKGFAEIHGQVGLNLAPCPQNCVFCSFAACNKIFHEKTNLPVQAVIEKCLVFEKAGANAIYLMATANFKFEDIIRIGKEVRFALKPDTVMVANVGDFEREQAVLLKKTGFAGVYHALRLGEGKDTGIKPERRLRSIQAAREVGLIIGTCVEPVGPEHTIEELVEKTLITREAGPCFSGAARRIPIPGTVLSKYGMVSEIKMAVLLAVVRLAMGYQVKGNCTHEPNVIGAAAGASLFWAETGSNPRDTSQETAENRGFSVARCQDLFEEADWKVLSGPSKMFTDPS